MRFFTAVFGKSHLQAGLGLVRSFGRHNPQRLLTVFTDQEGFFPNEELRSFRGLVEKYPKFYWERGGRPNVIKFSLFQEMREMYPAETITWLDADVLVLDSLRKHVSVDRINVIAHGRRTSEERVNCGGGLEVSGDRYVIGGVFSLPPDDSLEYLEKVTAERPSWSDPGGPNHDIGDQLILNHLVAARPGCVNWMSDDRRFIFNLEIADGWHPKPGDPGLARVKAKRAGSLTLDGRRIVILCWIKREFDQHLEDGFATFRPRVARRLRRLYRHP